MSLHRNAKHLATVLVAGLIGSCAATKVAGTNIQRVAHGEAVEANLATVHGKFKTAYAVLKTNVQKHWGPNDAEVANRTVYLRKKAWRVPSSV